MCGILGEIARRHTAARTLDLGLIGHRGPDGQGQGSWHRTSLGHTRLSIIDLAGGAQPMSDPTGSVSIVFNGEIYNFRDLRAELVSRGQRFATVSDTEVILGVYLAWGVEGFSRLRGMYAFAIHDHRDASTVLARDPFGIKPLFYSRTGDRLLFASEMGALVSLLGFTPTLDLSSVLETLVHRHPIGEFTLYQEVRRLAPGTALIVDGHGSISMKRIVSLPNLVEAERTAESKAGSDATRERVLDSIAHHAVADVPLGCFLSGGLDSSIVAAGLRHNGDARVAAFSIDFGEASTEQSEVAHARVVAEHVGAELHVVSLAPEDFLNLAPCLSGSLNGPFPDPADIAILKLSQRAALDVKVVLSGEGADEAFAGYPKYAVDRLAGPGNLLAKIISPLIGRRGRAGIALHALSENDRGGRWMRWFENDAVPASVLGALTAQGASLARGATWVEERISAYPRPWSDLQRMQMLDLECWLPNNLLHRGDYTTMQASLEQRVPFLDLALTPWAVALPDRAKIVSFRGKAALRQAFANSLPGGILRRPKSGFRLPLREWLGQRGPLREFVQDRLADPNAMVGQFMSREDRQDLLHAKGLRTTGGAKLAWTVLSLELWLDAHHRTDLRRKLEVGYS